MAQILSKPAIAQRIHAMLESCYGITARNARAVSSKPDTPLGKLCAQLDALSIQPPAPEESDPIQKVRRLKEDELREEEKRRSRVQAQLARLNPRARQIAHPPAPQAARHHRAAGHKQRKPPVSTEQQAVRDLDRFVPREPRDRVVVPDVQSEAALKARNELMDIQKRLEALQQLQSKLNQMDGQVEALAPEEPVAAVLAPELSFLPQPRYHGTNGSKAEADEVDTQMSAKERVLLRKEAERLEKQKEYEEQLLQARKMNSENNVVAEERKKHQYGMERPKVLDARVPCPEDRPARRPSEVEAIMEIEAELTKQLMESTARIEQLKIEHGGYDEEVEDPDTDGLTSESEEDFDLSEDEDDPSEMSGNLDARAQGLQKRCMEALGDKFERVYTYLKQAREGYDDAISEEAEAAMDNELHDLVGADLMGYVKLVDQLIFIEDCLR